MARKLKRIISGGQSGGDMGGLLAGRELGLETGGTAPPGWMTEFGPKKELLSKFGLVEGEPDPATYPKRTMKNVDSADLTIAFRFKDSTGTDKTIGYAQTGKWQRGELKPGLHMGKRGKPILVITEQNLENAARLISDAVQKLNPETVNIAGHREKSWPGVEKFVQGTLVRGLGSGTGAPKVISSPPSSSQPTGPKPTELKALWAELVKSRNPFSRETISATVTRLVGEGKIRPDAARAVGAMAVYAEDLIRQRDVPQRAKTLSRFVDERYFAGGLEPTSSREREAVKVARTGTKMSRGVEVRESPLKPETEAAILSSLSEGPGRDLVFKVLGRDVQEGTFPAEVGPKRAKTLWTAKAAELLERGQGEARKAPEKPGKPATGWAKGPRRLPKVVGSKVGTEARTASGKPVSFTFKGTDVPKYYKPELLRKLYAERTALVDAPPVEETELWALNTRARGGDALAALRLEKLMHRMFGVKQSFQGGTVRNPKTGKVIGVHSAEEKQTRKQAREARAFGGTASDVSRGIGSGRGARERPMTREEMLESRKAREGRISQNIRDAIKAGSANPLLPRTEGEIGPRAKKLAAANIPLVQRLRSMLEMQLRQGKVGPLSPRQERIIDRAALDLASRLPPIQASGIVESTPPVPRPNPAPESREIADAVAEARASGRPSRTVEAINRLMRIRAAQGLQPTPQAMRRRIGVGSAGSMMAQLAPRVRSLPIVRPSAPPMGRARRKPL